MANESFTKWREELFRSGAIGPLRIGASQEEVNVAFGPPDDVSTKKKNGRPIIFRYADVEFHFDHLHGHCLSLIYSESEAGEPRICIR